MLFKGRTAGFIVAPLLRPLARLAQDEESERARGAARGGRGLGQGAVAVTAITPDDQKFMAFESLLGWTAAVVNQAQRLSAAKQEFLKQIRRRSDLQAGQRREVVSVLILSQRLAQQSFQTERHLFCNAANQLLEYRRWVQRLSFLDESLFTELDGFAHDIDVMRDMNEHTIEYFEGKGHRPHDWVYRGEGAVSDASSTTGTKIGGRLDWVELGAAAERLFAQISRLSPFYPPRQTLPEHRVSG
jgi:hypothetical protein